MKLSFAIALLATVLLSIPTAAQTPPTEPEKPEQNSPPKSDPKADKKGEKKDEKDPDSKKPNKDEPIGNVESKPTEPAESNPDAKPLTEEGEVDGEVAASKNAPMPRTKYDIPKQKPTVDSAWNRDLSDFMRRYQWRLAIGGYIRAGYTAIQNDPGGNFGNHDGFGLANARLTLDGFLGKSAGFRFQIDGGAQRSQGTNDPNAELVVRARDMNIWFQPLRFARLTVGQFKAPFDAESLASNSDIPFVHRSVGNRGVKNVEGINRDGLSRDREAGAMISARLNFGPDRDKNEGFGVSYALAGTNGRSAELALNDNDALAGYVRLNAHWSEMVRVGGAIMINDQTVGIEPNAFDESLLGWTADVDFDLGWLQVFGSVIGISRSNELDSEFGSLAFQGSLALKDPFFGFQPVFRFARYDESDAIEGDALNYITFGLNYSPKYPFRILANYTLTGEEEPNTLSNNALDILVQVTW